MSKIPITADNAVFHFDFGVGIRATTEFGIEISYIGSSVDPVRIWPALSIDEGITFTDIEDLKFVLPQDQRLFSIRLQINNDPTTTKDYRVNLKVKPLNNKAYFTNPNGVETSVEYTNAGNMSAISVDKTENVSVDEGKYGVAHYTMVPPLAQSTTVQFAVSPAQALGTDIANLQFSLNNVDWVNIPASNKALVPQGATDFYLRFEAVLDQVMLEEEDVVAIILTEDADTPKLQGLPLVKNFTIVDKTILPSGTYINSFCQGYKKMGRYSDGLGGFTVALIKDNSPECGYVAAPYGTVLSTYCANYNFYERVADGNDGYFIRLKTENVPGATTGCGYVKPTDNTQTELTPTTLDKYGGALVNNNGLGFASLKRDGARSKYGSLWGKWYWEVRVSRPTSAYQPIAVGVATAAHSMSDWIGSDSNSWAWWPYDGTKYYNDHQEFYPATVNDGDIISVLLNMENHTLEFWLNGQTLGVAYSNIKDDPVYAVINAKDDSYGLANFGQYAFKYAVPNGFKPGFGVVTNPPPDRGAILRTFCDGYDRKQEIADGKYGSQIVVIETNSTQCGYNPIPSAGTILGYYCEGTTRYKKVADGQGGSTSSIYEINSVDCGYVAPPVPALIPTNLDPNWKTTNTVITNDNLTAEMDGSVRAVKSVYSGKWYWEVVAESIDIIVGIGTTAGQNTSNKIIGANNTTWGFNLADSTLVTNGIATPVNLDVSVNDIIGVALDFVNQKVSFSINGVWGEKLIFTDLPIVDYFPMISSTVVNPSELPKATIHFGLNNLLYPEPINHVPGYGTTTTVYPRKGTLYSYFCKGLDQWTKMTDGGGAYYDNLYQVNSWSCGWRPPDPVGTLKKKFCVGYDSWGTYADGNYGTYDQLILSPSTECNYKPRGYLLSARCEGFTRIGTFSDGLIPQGSYQEIISENSRDCGYSDGGGGGTDPGTTIDPNLPVSIPGGILITISVIPDSETPVLINKPLT